MFFKMRSGLLTGLGLLAFLGTACVVTSADDDKDKDNPNANADPNPSDSDAGTSDPDASNGEPGSDSGTGNTDIDYGDDYTEECGETGKNDTRETAAVFGKNAQICIEDGDEDWLKVTVPASGGAYLLKVGFAQADGVRFGLNVIAGADNSKIGSNTASDAGTSGSFAVTVGAGTTTYVQFTRYNGQGLVNLTLDITPENDAYEPNNTRDDAAQISVNEDVKGQHWIPYVSNADQSADDWFKVDLAAGAATFKMTQVPENVRLQVKVVGPTFANVASGISPNTGALHSVDFTVTEAGTHYIQLYNYGTTSRGPFLWNENPKSLSEQYTMRIEQ